MQIRVFLSRSLCYRNEFKTTISLQCSLNSSIILDELQKTRVDGERPANSSRDEK